MFKNMRCRPMLMFLVPVIIMFTITDASFNQNTNNFFSLSNSKLKEYMSQYENRLNAIPKTPSNNISQTEQYTDWSRWSRCMDCVQRRIKTCLAKNCHGSRIYEERPCNRKRCKRKSRHKEYFHVVYLNKDIGYLTKHGPSLIWSKWSRWTECSETCWTFRIRKCRKTGKCGNRIQKEKAYCYHKQSRCELYVLNLMESRKYSYILGATDDYRYQYHDNKENTNRQSKQRYFGKKQCGIPYFSTNMLRIIGGAEANQFKWPWHVAVLNQYGEAFCGGTLISPRWVLTANHCVRKHLRVRLNAHDLLSDDGSAITMGVSKMFQHPRFNYRTVDNDIALLLLPTAVRLPVACLPRKSPKSGQMCSVMGWGKINTANTYGTPILHEAQLPIVHSKTCKRSYKHFLISDNMVCAGWASGRSDTCAGDSGGGLMCPRRNKHSNVVYTVQGITSFGDGCGRRNKYGIYTAVFNYLSWINYNIDHYF